MNHTYRHIDITTDRSVPFRVILVPEGVPSPHHTYRDGSKALVEFYDRRYTGKGFTPDGQFVTRYSLDTVLTITSGLMLDMGIPSWHIDAAAMNAVVEWLKVEADR